MIDLNCTRAQLLADIDAPNLESEPLSDITDKRIATSSVHVRLCGHVPDDLFPFLKLALSERFATVSRAELFRDLFIPLKNALGNAYKHGNGRDAAKAVMVEMVLTPKGALIAITDEGQGFDVARTFQRFQEKQQYFVNQGSGFLNLHRAQSTVSYEHSGRTMLLCYRPPEELEHSSLPPSTRSAETTNGGNAPAEAGHDSRWTQIRLPAAMPEFRDDAARIESCRVYASPGPDSGGYRYVLQVARRDGGVETRILTGRLHASTAAAQADFAAASALHHAVPSTPVRIPKPAAGLVADPRLVLFAFNPSMNLSEYLAYRGSLRSVRHSSERVGSTLASLHRSDAVLPEVESGLKSGLIGEQLKARVARAETTLRTLPAGPDLARRFRASVDCEERSSSWHTRTMALIHGSLDWNCIHYGVDGRFYLYRFENCQPSDPGLDLGGFAADLLCFTLAHHDAEAYRVCSDELLKHYNAGAECSMSAEDLRVYTALALCQRLDCRNPATTAVSEAQLIAALDFLLRDGIAGPH
jgi:anti-sigma regulatory factor (Ser/Thr protein kinase)